MVSASRRDFSSEIRLQHVGILDSMRAPSRIRTQAALSSAVAVGAASRARRLESAVFGPERR